MECVARSVCANDDDDDARAQLATIDGELSHLETEATRVQSELFGMQSAWRETRGPDGRPYYYNKDVRPSVARRRSPSLPHSRRRCADTRDDVVAAARLDAASAQMRQVRVMTWQRLTADRCSSDVASGERG